MSLGGYDAWKTRLPDWWEGEPDAPCPICADIGWDTDHNNRVVPCPNCAAPVTWDDVIELDDEEIT
jgi:endogenous inhibitor of DNA gyrase (YacG/DUF329 family)